MGEGKLSNGQGNPEHFVPWEPNIDLFQIVEETHQVREPAETPLLLSWDLLLLHRPEGVFLSNGMKENNEIL
jgi:hypothetical protein